MGLVSLLFSFNGRINRVQYWLGCIIGGVGGAFLLFLLTLLTMPAAPFPQTAEGLLQLLSSVSFAFGVPLMLMGWVGTALQTKRFHDRGRSGLFVLLPLLPVTMIVSAVVSGAATGAPFQQVMSSITLWFLLLQLINLFMFVDLGCMPGKPEPNKYGNPPGGGFSGGAPAGGAPRPGREPVRSAHVASGMGGSTLTSAESAIERAIAARSKQPAEAASPVAAPRPAMALQPAGGLRPPAAGSFGGKRPLSRSQRRRDSRRSTSTAVDARHDLP